MKRPDNLGSIVIFGVSSVLLAVGIVLVATSADAATPPLISGEVAGTPLDSHLAGSFAPPTAIPARGATPALGASEPPVAGVALEND